VGCKTDYSTIPATKPLVMVLFRPRLTAFPAIARPAFGRYIGALMIFRILLTSLLLAAAAPAAFAEATFPPVSRVGLEVPAELKVSSRIRGFEDLERKVVVEVNDLPRAAYDKIMQSAFTDELAGARNIKRESFPYRLGIGYLISGDTTEDGVERYRLSMIGSPIQSPPYEDLVAVIRVSLPQAARDVYTDDVIRTMLASVTYRRVPLEEHLAQLPFRVSEFSGFRVLQVSPPGTLVLIDGEGSDLMRQPYLIVSAGPGTVGTDDRARAARNLMASAPFRDINVQFADTIRVANTPTHEILAQAQTQNGSPISVVQWVRFGSAGHMRIVGVSPRESWEQLFPRFRAVRDAIEPPR
jgi:hypothetical protein